MPNVSIQIEGLDRMVKKFGSSSSVLVRHFQTAITKAAILLQQAARIEAPVDIGQLRTGIILGPLTGLTGSVVARAPYAFWVHEGRKPGKMPPVAALEAWAARHGMPGAGFPIARKIAQKGTKPNPFFTRAKAAVEGDLPAIWRAAAEAVVQEIATSQ
jgi:hypothetical protein